MGAYLLTQDSTSATSTLKFDVVTSENWAGQNTVTEHPVETGADVADNVRVGLSKCTLVVFVTNEPFKANTWATPVPQTVTITIAGPAQDPVNPVLTLTAQEWDNGLALRTALQGAGAAAGTLVGGATGGLIGNVAGGVLGQILDPPHEVDVPFVPGVGLDPTPGATIGPQLVTIPTQEDFPRRMYSALETMRQTVQLITVVGSKNYKPNMVIESVEMDRSADTGTGAEFTIVLRELRFVTTQTVTAPQPTIPRANPPVSKGPQNPTQAPPQKRKSGLKWLQGILGATPPALAPGGDLYSPGG